MTKPKQGASGPMPAKHPADLAAERADARLRQALYADNGHYVFLRGGAALLRITGVATLVAAAVGAFLVSGTAAGDNLGVSNSFVVASVAVVGFLLGLPQLVLAEILTMQVFSARRSRFQAVVLAELNATIAEMNRRAATGTATATPTISEPRRVA